MPSSLKVLDVVWINVPKIVPTKAQEAGRDLMTVSGVDGAVTNPVKPGFVASDTTVLIENWGKTG